VYALSVVLLRVGVDSGSGGIQGPLLSNVFDFDYVPIPDYTDTDPRKYGTERGRFGRTLAEYFPSPRQEKMAKQSIHYDPEFSTFTYGDPTSPKARLRRLEPGSLLVFYCGLEGWNKYHSDPALYIMGYFEVSRAGLARQIGDDLVHREFSKNFHVRHPSIYSEDRGALVLVKGGRSSRLLNRAFCISEMGVDRKGKPLKILSHKMRRIVGDFGGRVSIQRSPPRWVWPEFSKGAMDFVRSLD